MSLTTKNKKVVKKTAKKKIKTAESCQKNYYYYQKLPKKIIANKYLIVSVNITLFLFTTNNTLRAGVKFFVCTNFLPKIFNDLHRHHKLRHWINSNTCNIEQREETGCKNTNTPTTPTHKKIHPSETDTEREREPICSKKTNPKAKPAPKIRACGERLYQLHCHQIVIMGRLYSLVQTGFHKFIMPLLVAFTRVLFICMFGKAILQHRLVLNNP